MASIFDELTTTWLKESFLLGIDLTLDDGSPYPDTIYEQSLRAGVAYLEHELGIVIEQPRVVTSERHDALDINRDSWWGFRLDQRPVLSLQDWSLQYGSFNPVDMPVSWLQALSREHGQIALIPSADSLGSFLYSAGVPLLVGGFQQPYSYLPGYFSFDYTAGFDMRDGSDTIADGQTSVTVTLSTPVLEPFRSAYVTGDSGLGTLTLSRVSNTEFTITSSVAATGGNGAVAWSITTLPRSILHCIGLKAALLPIDVAGDLIAGAGVANFSIGADGVHQSLGTTSSATNSGYGARRGAFERELKALLPALRAKYKSLNFGVI